MIKNIVEDTLDKNYLTYLKFLLTGPDFRWQFMRSTAYPEGHPLYNEHKGWTFSLAHRFIDNSQPCSDQFSTLFPAVLQILSKHNVNLTEVDVRRAQVNLITRSSTHIEHGAHVDHEGVPHDVFIWYLDDSDGDTIIYNQMNEIGKLPTIDSLTVDQRIKPEKNKSIHFDGLTYHSSSSPVDHDTRILMNINVMPKFGHY